MDHYARAYEVFGRIRGYRGLQRMLSSLRGFGKSEIAQQRMKIIGFYKSYGEAATREAFGADRKLISRWRKRLRDNGGKLSEGNYMGLTPLSEAAMQLMGRCGNTQLAPVTNTKSPEIILCSDNGEILQTHSCIVLKRS